MIKLVQPQITDLKYRKKLLKDKKTMAFNKINGGTVDFNEKIWKSWYQLWMNDTKHYYAYVYDDEIKKYIGEVSYYFEEEYREYVLNIIIEYPYRHLGRGKVALEPGLFFFTRFTHPFCILKTIERMKSYGKEVRYVSHLFNLYF